jgi:hypothetical protein
LYDVVRPTCNTIPSVVGRQVHIVVENLIWNEGIEAHFARHGVACEDVIAVTRGDFLAFENLPDRGGTHVMVGPDREWTHPLCQRPAGLGRRFLGARDRLGKPSGQANLDKGKRWIAMMESLEDAVKKAEAVKDTEQELEGLVPVKMTVSPNLGIVYSLRFSMDEMSFLREAAESQGMKLSEFIRDVAMKAAAEVQGKPSPRDEALKEARDLVGAAAKALDRIAKP